MAQQQREKVSLQIDGDTFSYWSEIEIKRSIDAFSSVSFSAPFESSRSEFRDRFRPFSYQSVTLTVADELLFTGTLIDVDPKTDADSSTVTVTAYSTPAVLEDCTPADSSFPLEFNNLGLRAIATRLAAPFGITVRFEAPEGAKFKRVACDPEKKVHEFLADLARQRSLVISSTASGELLFRRSTFTGSPVARLIEGEPPLTFLTPKFTPRSYYSQLTGISPSGCGKRGGKYTTKNPRLVESHTPKGRLRKREEVALSSGLLAGVLRPLTVKLDDTEMADIPTAIKAKVGRMFGGMVCYTAGDLPTWRDPTGRLWKPNTTIMLTAPNAMVYAETELLIKEVSLKQDSDSRTATLELALPGAFNGEIPPSLPWLG